MRSSRSRPGFPGATAECEYPDHFGYSLICGGRYGYVWGTAAQFGDIHLCQPTYHKISPLDRARGLIHEAAHLYLGTTGETYYAQYCQDIPDTRLLSDAERLKNADCYACLAAKSGLVVPGTPPAPPPPEFAP